MKKILISLAVLFFLQLEMMGNNYFCYKVNKKNKNINITYIFYAPKDREEVFNENKSNFDKALQKDFDDACRKDSNNNIDIMYVASIWTEGTFYKVLMAYSLTSFIGSVVTEKDDAPIYIYTQGLNYNDYYNEYERLVNKYLKEAYN